MADPYVSAVQARDQSDLLAAAFVDDAEGNADLTAHLLLTSVIVGELTGRTMVDGQPGEAVPDYLDPVADRAVIMKAEQSNVRGGSADARRRAIGRGNLQSFSAGPYAESYFGPTQAQQAKMLDPDPETSEVLWALATEEKKAEWLFFWGGELAPAAAPQAFDYSSRPGATSGRPFRSSW